MVGVAAAELRSSGADLALSADTAIPGAVAVLGATAPVGAGLREEYGLAGRPLEWWQSMGAGFVLIGLAFLLPALTAFPSSSEFVSVFGGAVTILSGYAQLRTGPPTEDDSDLSMRGVAVIVAGGMLVISAILFVNLFFTFG